MTVARNRHVHRHRVARDILKRYVTQKCPQLTVQPLDRTLDFAGVLQAALVVAQLLGRRVRAAQRQAHRSFDRLDQLREIDRLGRPGQRVAPVRAPRRLHTRPDDYQLAGTLASVLTVVSPLRANSASATSV